MPAIECRDGLLVEPFGCCDHRSIDGAEWQVAVMMDKFGDPKPVCGGHGLDAEVAAGEIAEEPDLGI